jgi:hypothetical protein
LTNKCIVSLPRDFAVWLVSDEAKFLRGKLVWCNWDVKELLAKKEEILNSQELMTIVLSGLSFQHWNMKQVEDYASGSQSV